MLAAVVDGDGVTNHLGEDGGRAGPGLQHALLAGFVHFLDPLEQLSSYIGALLDRSAH